MTETEWLAATDPTLMLEFLRENVSDRKLRLFAVACCRRIWHLLKDEPIRQAVEVSERLADGLATDAERRASALKGVGGDAERSQAVLFAGGGIAAAGSAAVCAVGVPAFRAADRASALAASAFALTSAHPIVSNGEINPGWVRLVDTERACQSALLRHIVGNPFKPVVVDPSWLTSTVLLLAHGIYDEKASDRLPILADALQDAGCDEPTVLAHCQCEGPHVRGCWLIDMLLGKG